MRTKILRKIFNTTITMFVILIVFTITTYEKNNTLRTNVEIKNISNITTNEVYLKNEDNYLVKTNIFLENGKNIIPNLINYLTITNKKAPVGLNSYIPKNTKLLSYKQNNDLVTLNFSKEFLSDEKNKQLIITGVVYSLLELKDIKNVKIEVEEIPLSGYNEILNRNIGINKANGELPDFKKYQVKMNNHGDVIAQDMIELGKFVRDIIKLKNRKK